jgi:squalene synthase HpnC
MGVGHYENFPVASLLMPASLRPAVRAIYRFARTADDIADEGDLAPAERIAQLQALARELHTLDDPNGAWPDLARAVAQHQLDRALLADLLSAFTQDVTTTRYADLDALLDYCRRSANPIGRLLLQLFRRNEPALAAMSDAICSGLQLTNFWQDVAIDWKKGRVYIPREELDRFGVSEDDIAGANRGPRWQALIRFETERTRNMLRAGAPLASALGGRIGMELRLVVQGGLRILERIDAAGGDVFTQRPALRSLDWTLMGWRALRAAA